MLKKLQKFKFQKTNNYQIAKIQFSKQYSLKNLEFEMLNIGIYLKFVICVLDFHNVYVEYFFTSSASSRARLLVSSSSRAQNFGL